jgi:methylase of polypeptide subunit release factors
MVAENFEDSSKIIQETIDEAKSAYKHEAKEVVLSKFLEKEFNVELQELLKGIEKKVGSKILGVKGRIDLLYSSVIFEIKINIEEELETAKDELKKYFQALLEERPGEKFVGIVTDVITYKAFIPIVDNGRVIDIKEISSMNLSKVTPGDAILWLDAYIFSNSNVIPTANDLKFRFGPESPTYALAITILKSLWDRVKNENDVALKYELWSKTMQIVYGNMPTEDAFIDQTYLVTLIKLILYLRLSGEKLIDRDRILKTLTGEYFKNYGIVNLIEEDFFLWITHKKIVDETLELIKNVAKEFLVYDLQRVDEDFFKEIYQEIVKRGERHSIGEYYTPEWVTELVLKEVTTLWWSKNKKPPRILDPACGSGTFLCNIIFLLKNKLRQEKRKQEEILNFILTNVVGIDINPVAVIIAKANYLLALGDLLNAHKGSIMIPIYVADSIKLPSIEKKIFGNIKVYKYAIEKGRYLQIPTNIAKDREKLNKVIIKFKDVIEFYKKRKDKKEASTLFKNSLKNVTATSELEVLEETLKSVLQLIDEDKDSIWIYMLNNMYMPISLSEAKFDIIVGNPPWIAMRYIENKEYQKFIKQKIFEYNLLDKNQTQLFPQIETATLFYCMSTDLYLKDNGIIGFVMPKSVLTGAMHHEKFRQFKKPQLRLVKIYDLENVSPLFNVPSCILISIKGESTSYPVNAIKYTGKLPKKNIKLNEVNKYKYLQEEDYKYQLPSIPNKHSDYYDKIKAGASIYPRCFFFIDFDVHPSLKMDLEKPLVKTSEELVKNAKVPWKAINLSGNVDTNFIYSTLLGGDILPFGYTKLRPVVLPVEVKNKNSYAILDIDDIRKKGYLSTADWFEKAQKYWEDLATKNMLKQYPRLVNYIDYEGTLSNQSPIKNFLILYNTSGKNVTACVINKQKLEPFSLDRATIKPKGFIVEKSTMYYETDEEREAHYLCAILNSDILNKAIKPIQTKGLFGERGIVRRPFMVYIPKFDCNNSLHNKLADLSKECHEKVSIITLTKKSIASKRKEIREKIKDKIEEINKHVHALTGLA